MKITRLKASRYRSLKSIDLSFDALNLLIGANASGKSNVLDALRLLSEGVQAKDFSQSVIERGSILHLAWKGEGANQISLDTYYAEEQKQYHWSVSFQRLPHGFEVRERLYELYEGKPPGTLLEASGGKGWWWSAQAKDNQVRIALAPTACVLAAACADESFPARRLGAFIQRWGFFDPTPPLIKRSSTVAEAERLDAFGRNLAARLYVLQQETPHGGELITHSARREPRSRTEGTGGLWLWAGRVLRDEGVWGLSQ